MVSLLQTVDTSHDDMIHDAQMDYYGTKLATCSSDKLVKIFEISGSTQTHVADLFGHDGPVWQVAWAHPMFGSLLASCSYDRKVIVWKESEGKWDKVFVYHEHESSVNSLSWAPHEYGLILACGSSDGSVSILTCTGENKSKFDTSKIHNAHTIGCNAVSWQPAVNPDSVFDGTKKQPVKRIVTGGCDNLVKIWFYMDTEEKWVEEEKLEGHSDWIRDVAWAPSVGLPNSAIASCSQDRRVIIWTTSKDDANKWTAKVLYTFNDVIWHVSWNVTGNVLAVSGGDNKVSLWKESQDGQWMCISDVNKGQGQPPEPMETTKYSTT